MSSYLYVARDWMEYLHHPPPSSWVVRVAATFRVLALLCILPWIGLMALDIASYLIVRTLGADSVHKLDPAATPPYATSPVLTVDDGSQRVPTVMVAADNNDTYFTTLSNPALSGEGIFSPPESRSSSPPTTRSNRRTPTPASLTVTEINQAHDYDDSPVLRLRSNAKA